jgi:murein DD-endopeptidase
MFFDRLWMPALGNKRNWVRCCLLLIVTLCGGTSVALPPPTSLQQSFDLQIPYRPMPVVIGGERQLVYELHLTNFASADLTLKRLEILDSAGVVLSDLQGSQLEQVIGRTDHTNQSIEKLRIPPGLRALVYLSVPLRTSDANSIALTHRLEYQATGQPNRASVLGGTFTINAEPPISIGPPVRGGLWVAIYNTSWPRGHRRVPYSVEGSVHIPGRFAIDWIKVDKQGKYFDADGSNVRDWYGYSSEVLAVKDGTIVAARDGVPESATLVTNPASIKLEQASGNYVALDLGDGHYAFYEHLKPGSIRVKAGDHVRRGSVIGLLGYTGESTGPHLHFHIANNNSPLNAEGLPYQLDGFTIIGSYPMMETFAKSQPWSVAPAGTEVHPHGEFPAPFTVVRFPD